ncbi:hypothetical protein IWX50DRAFT_634247 [Phyllosticta citricarpa]
MVWMWCSLAVRMMRTAISPRLAISSVLMTSILPRLASLISSLLRQQQQQQQQLPTSIPQTPKQARWRRRSSSCRAQKGKLATKVCMYVCVYVSREVRPSVRPSWQKPKHADDEGAPNAKPPLFLTKLREEEEEYQG